MNLRVKGRMAFDGKSELQEGLELLDLNRHIGHENKGTVIKGERPHSFEEYLKLHPETIIAMANFGLGLYEPTLKVLKLIKPRLIRGSL